MATVCNGAGNLPQFPKRCAAALTEPEPGRLRPGGWPSGLTCVAPLHRPYSFPVTQPQTYPFARDRQVALRSPAAPVRFLLRKKPLRPCTSDLTITGGRIDGLCVKGKEQGQFCRTAATVLLPCPIHSVIAVTVTTISCACATFEARCVASTGSYRRGAASRSGVQLKKACREKDDEGNKKPYFIAFISFIFLKSS